MPAAQPFKKVGSEKQSKLSKAALELRNCTKPGHNYNFYLLEIGLMSLNVYTLKVILCMSVHYLHAWCHWGPKRVLDPLEPELLNYCRKLMCGC